MNTFVKQETFSASYKIYITFTPIFENIFNVLFLLKSKIVLRLLTNPCIARRIRFVKLLAANPNWNWLFLFNCGGKVHRCHSLMPTRRWRQWQTTLVKNAKHAKMRLKVGTAWGRTICCQNVGEIGFRCSLPHMQIHS